MQNFIQFLVRFHAFFLFVGMQILCFYLIAQRHHYQRSILYNTFTESTGFLHNSVTGATDYVNLRTVNDSLIKENARLREQVLMHELLGIIAEQDSVSKTDTIPIDSTRAKIYVYQAAKVINNSTNKLSNFITINKGREDGFRPEMGIVSNQGIVGITKNVSAHFSTIMSMLHKDMRVSAKIKINGYVGTLRWDGKDPQQAILTDIPKHVLLKEGDEIVSSGYSSFFPEGIPIGIIESFSLEQGGNFYRIEVALSTPFGNIDYVYGVDYQMQEEQKQLEEQSVNE